MPFRRARIECVEFAVNDSVEGHRARSRANHRGKNQAECFPARPAAIFPRGHEHRRQRERQCENRVREPHERTPFLNYGKHFKPQMDTDETQIVFERDSASQSTSEWKTHLQSV